MDPEKTQEKSVIGKISAWNCITNDLRNVFQDKVHSI